MEVFRTVWQTPLVERPIDLKEPIVSVGSCFAERIGGWLWAHKLPVMVNPFGTLYNPISVSHLLQCCLTGQLPDEQYYIERDGLWMHYDLHSKHYATTQKDLQDRLQQVVQRTGQFLRQSRWLFITLGTANAYHLNANNHVVANCHKMPQGLFTKKLLPLERITQTLQQTLEAIKTAVPDIEVIITVSPVRHIKDGIPQNSVSKATLRLAAHQLQEQAPWIHYYPAYELLMDDLRDYRFYESDMVHPSGDATQYIRNDFAQSWLTPAAQQWLKLWGPLRQALQHRAQQPEGAAYQKFLQNTRQRLAQLQQEYAVNLQQEIQQIEQRLKG